MVRVSLSVCVKGTGESSLFAFLALGWEHVVWNMSASYRKYQKLRRKNKQNKHGRKQRWVELARGLQRNAGGSEVNNSLDRLMSNLAKYSLLGLEKFHTYRQGCLSGEANEAVVSGCPLSEMPWGASSFGEFRAYFLHCFVKELINFRVI